MNTKIKILCLIALFAIAMIPEIRISAQQGGGCTNYGCVEVRRMSQVYRVGNGAPQQGCVNFLINAPGATGRKLRHDNPQMQGDSPRRLPGRQIIKFGGVGCPGCTPPAPNYIAVTGGGGGAFVDTPIWGTFGNYECPPRNPINNP